jgi:hypothetical protein
MPNQNIQTPRSAAAAISVVIERRELSALSERIVRENGDGMTLNSSFSGAESAR